MTVVILLHLATFFVVAMVCHGELAASRPPTEYLTQFYLLMSLGGVLGGTFNAMAAPLLFDNVAEYNLAMIFACLLLPRTSSEERPALHRALDLVLPLALGVVTGVLLFLFEPQKYPNAEWALQKLYGVAQEVLRLIGKAENGLTVHRVRLILQLGVPAVICYAFVGRPLRLGLGVAAILVAHGYYMNVDSMVVYQKRSFFGVLRVEYDPSDNTTKLVHGTTLHGKQRRAYGRTIVQGEPQLVIDMEVLARFLTPLAAGNLAEAVVASATGSELARQRLHEPITYYHRTGPVGQLFESLNGPRGDRPAAFIGLGTGTLASYARPGQEVHYYDIDVEVERLARNPTYFTFLQDSRRRGVRLDVVLGDARLRLREAPDGHYGLIIVDAFSSDAIPIHLITREALQLYLQKLAPDGVLAVHISNRYLDLEPVLGNAAEELRLAGRIRVDRDEDEPGKSSSDWVVLAREESHLGMLAEHERWKALATRSDLRVWTDDFSNLLGVFNWK
jgi:hypothetical protein